MITTACFTKDQERRCPNSLKDRKSSRKKNILQVTLAATFLYPFDLHDQHEMP